MWLDMSVLKESRGRKKKEKFNRASSSEQQQVSHGLNGGVTGKFCVVAMQNMEAGESRRYQSDVNAMSQRKRDSCCFVVC